MTAEKLAFCLKVIEHAKEVFVLLSALEPHEIDTAKGIAAREARYLAEQIVLIQVS